MPPIPGADICEYVVEECDCLAAANIWGSRFHNRLLGIPCPLNLA
jgi:hypothetical protein